MIGHTTINWTLEYISASTVAVIILAEPIGATILAYFILNEGVSLAKIIGAVIIIIGVLITLKAESKNIRTGRCAASQRKDRSLWYARR